VRIGFFEWVEKKHEAIFGGSDKKEVGDAAPSTGITVRTMDKKARVGPEGEPAAALGRKKITSRLYSCLCLKCGQDSLHWMLDTSAGLVLSVLFAASSAWLLTGETAGCGDHC
jgi:hypothetical protein